MRRLTKEERRVKDAVFARDIGCRLSHLPGAGPCAGHATVHHRRKASQGGGYTEENLVAACSVHNDALESDPDLAQAARNEGLLLREVHGDPEWEACGRA